MPLTVRLDLETERLVRRLIRQRRETKSQVIRAAIRTLAAQELRDEARTTPFEALKHLLGCVNSGGRHLSKRTGEQFTELLLERQRARRSR